MANVKVIDLIAKVTPVDADVTLIIDSAAASDNKKITFGNIKAFIKTYTDTLYPSGSGTVSGSNTGDNAINTLYSGVVSNATHTGDATGATALTLATVNANLGSFGLAGSIAQFTVNAKGLITAAANVAISVTASQVSDFAATVRSTTLTGLSLISTTVISATDTILVAVGSLQAQITALTTSVGTKAASATTISTTAPLSGGGDLSANRTLTTSMNTNKLIGRGTAAVGVMEEITLGTNLSLTGNTLNVTGTAAELTSGITNALKSATTTVDVSAATAPTVGQVLTATAGTAATWQTPSGGSGTTWTEVTTTSQAAAVNNGYVTNNAALVTVTLPATASVGQMVYIQGSGAGGFRLGQNASQTIVWDAGGVAGTNITTAGTGGSISSSDRYDSIEVMCITLNTGWVVRGSKGNLIIV